MEKNCPKCNAAFTCKSNEAGCWCNDVKLSSYTLQYLAENFKNCLCPNCLQPFEMVDRDAEVDMDDLV
jgi:Zn finger protein HypA/HybF involved in hydrogenase expression